MSLGNLLKAVGPLLLIMVLHSVTSWAQSHIRGVVTDAESGDPVAYASVGVPEQQIAVSANAEGFFIIRIQLNASDHLEISSVGYRKQRIPLSQIDEQLEVNISLDPEYTLLSEIVVRGNALELEDIIKNSSKNRKIYLRDDSYLMNGFYRETLMVNHKYRGFTEAQGIFFINGYDPRHRNYEDRGLTYDLAQWKNMRRTDYPKDQYLRIGRLLKAKDYYLYEGPLARENLQDFNYQVEDTTQYDGQRVLVISFEPPLGQNHLNYRGNLMVKEDDQALIGMSIEQTGALHYLPDDSEINSVKSTFQINFSLFNEKYHLKNVIYTEHYRYQDVDNHYKVELVGQEFSNQDAPFINRAQRAVLFSDMLNPAVNYDPEWWENNQFAGSDVYTEVSQDMEDVEQQFKKHHQMRLKPLPEGVENYEQMVNEQNLLDFFMQY